MGIDVRARGAVDVVDVRGDLTRGPELKGLRDRLRGLLAAGESLLVLNLREVSDLDSYALGELVIWRERIRKRDGVIKLVLPAPVYDLFVATRLDSLFEIFRDEEAALDGFAAETETAGIP